MQRIESSDNKKIKRLYSLKQKKVRFKENLFLMEGLKSVAEAIDEDAEIDMILLSDSFVEKNDEFCQKLDDTGITVFVTADRNADKCSSLKTPPGIIASVKKPAICLDDVISLSRPVVILDGMKDPGNMGTIIRNADAFGFPAVLLLPGCVDPYSPKTIQSSMGSILRAICKEIVIEDIDRLSEAGYAVYGMDMNGRDMNSEKFADNRTAVIIGNESHGLSSQITEKCSAFLKINMPGNAESLNASVAAGIVMNKISQIIF